MKPSVLRSIFCIATLAGVCALVRQVNAQNIVADPGFEASADDPNGNAFSPAWTLVETNGFSVVGGDSALAHSGNNYAALSPDFDATGSLFQTLSTTPGASYDFSFWMAHDVSTAIDTTNFIEVFWNGAPAPVWSFPDVQVQGYLNYVVPNLTATGTSTTLEFRYHDNDDFFRVDDVSVTAAVPEPSTVSFAMVGFGLLALSFGVRAKFRGAA